MKAYWGVEVYLHTFFDLDFCDKATENLILLLISVLTRTA